MLNFVSLHTTSMVNTWVLFHLAAYPEYVPELREEIEKVLEESEWTSAAMNSLQKLDSFIKEVMRVRPVIGGNTILLNHHCQANSRRRININVETTLQQP